MERVNVESSHIKAIGYETEISTLQIEFLDGKIYEYYDVPSYVHDELMSAESKGSYAHKNIYKNYRQQRLN